jgi:[acyl-carrier-protein] S-malonyltransferase
MRTCFLFPGQGAQYPGMGEDFWDSSESVRELFRQASLAAGIDMKRLLFEASAEELRSTDKTQLAITLMNLASAVMLGEKGIVMDGCAGFSLGEYAALHAAGVIRLEDLFPIVKIRGDLMEKASRSLDSASGKPGMAAVLGLPSEKVAATVQSMASTGVFIANHNSPVQMVLSGTPEGLAKAEAALKAAGAQRIVRLKVSGPFHSPLLADAAKAFEEALQGFTFSEPRLPVYSNVTGKLISSASEARTLCGKQIISPVRWVAVEESLLGDGFQRFVEAGPGTVLTGLFKALKSDVLCAPAGELPDIMKIVSPS